MPPLSYFRVDRRYYGHNVQTAAPKPAPERTAEQQMHDNRVALSERASG